jgi:hypothetical protein
MATIGEILDEFFSPFSTEKLWIMPESDRYTEIVRAWQPVIDAVDRAKTNLEDHCADWGGGHVTSPSWTPGMTDPPVVDPNSYRVFVPSPPGTDPETCKEAFEIYIASKVARGLSRLPMPMPIVPPVPEIQTFALYTCSIGSFNIYATVDSVDCAAKTAKMNIWMFNAMSKRSFGRYAKHPAFSMSKMAKQYMWWNWAEPHSWGAAAPAPATPRPQSGTADW